MKPKHFRERSTVDKSTSLTKALEAQRYDIMTPQFRDGEPNGQLKDIVSFGDDIKSSLMNTSEDRDYYQQILQNPRQNTRKYEELPRPKQHVIDSNKVMANAYHH